MINAPVFGPIINGKQTVTVYDKKNNIRRTILTNPKEAEEFTNLRNKETKKAAQKGILQGLGITALATGIGVAINMIKKSSLSTKHLFKQIKIAKMSTTSYKDFAKVTVAHIERFIKSSKNSIKEGALLGAAVGSIIGFFKPAANIQKVENKMTELLIKNNKEETNEMLNI